MAREEAAVSLGKERGVAVYWDSVTGEVKLARGEKSGIEKNLWGLSWRATWTLACDRTKMQ